MEFPRFVRWFTMRAAEEADYWLAATVYEAYVGLGDEQAADVRLQRANALDPADWMRTSTKNRVAELRRLLHTR